MALLCASAKRSRLLLEVVFDACQSVRRRLSPRKKAISRQMSETVFALNFLETGGTVDSESFEKWSTPCCPQTWHHLHFTVSTL